MKKSHSGFTLVELLIALIILGALSATMMLSSGDSVAAAKAHTIVTNLSTIKNAVLLYYAANREEIAEMETPKIAESFQKKAKEYLGDTAITSNDVEPKPNSGNIVMRLDELDFVIQENDWSNCRARCDFSRTGSESERNAISQVLIELANDAKLLNSTGKGIYDGTYEPSFVELRIMLKPKDESTK